MRLRGTNRRAGRSETARLVVLGAVTFLGLVVIDRMNGAAAWGVALILLALAAVGLLFGRQE